MKKQVMLAMVLGLGLLGALEVRAEVLPSFLTSAVEAPASCRTEAAAKPAFLRRSLPTKASCTAVCPAGGSVSASCGGTCTSVDVNCPTTAGYVLCNGVRTDCAVCPAGPYCQSLNGTTCSPNGSTTSCTIAEGYPQTCTCRLGHWSCPF